MSAVCIAVIGKDNAPLYLATAEIEKKLDLHYRVHAALDIIEERCHTVSKANGQESKELYLGMLYVTENHKIYGYVTNTKIKFIAVIDAGNLAIKDKEIRTMFQNLHVLYTNAICNPFYVPGLPLESKKFQNGVEKLLHKNII